MISKFSSHFKDLVSIKIRLKVMIFNLLHALHTYSINRLCRYLSLFRVACNSPIDPGLGKVNGFLLHDILHFLGPRTRFRYLTLYVCNNLLSLLYCDSLKIIAGCDRVMKCFYRLCRRFHLFMKSLL